MIELGMSRNMKNKELKKRERRGEGREAKGEKVGSDI